MRSKAAALVTAFTLLLAAPSWAQTIRVRVWSPFVTGEDGTPGASIQVLLMDGEGRTKGWETTTVNAYGEWDVRFLSLGVFIMPGDRLTVWEDLAAYELDDIRAVRITRISPQRDVVAGRISPPRPEVEVGVTGTRITPAGETSAEMLLTVPAAEDGTFSADFSAAGDIMRLDGVYAGYRAGVFIVHDQAFSPGLTVYNGSNLALLKGMRGVPYTLDLLNRRGRVRSSAVTQVGQLLVDYDYVEFFRPGGAPVLIKPGNRIRVSGPWGFTDRVDRLSLAVDETADTFTVWTRPGAVVKLGVERLVAYRTADENGMILHNWSVSDGWDIQPSDMCTAVLSDEQGNMYQLLGYPRSFP